jgi:hypothetical protein
MALVKGTNSYATVEEADAYFADRLDVASWTAATPENKAKALVTASRSLDDMTWTGTAVSEGQSLAFPRNGSYFDPRLGASVEFTASVPNRVITAVFEMAYHLINNDGALDESGGVKNLKVGSIALDFIQAAPKVPFSVRKLVNPLLMNSGASTWWRAN